MPWGKGLPRPKSGWRDWVGFSVTGEVFREVPVRFTPDLHLLYTTSDSTSMDRPSYDAPPLHT